VLKKDTRLLTLLGVSAFVFVLQPYRWWARFTFPLAALAAVATAVIMSLPLPTAPRRRSAGRPALLLGAITASVLVVQPALFSRTVMPTDGSRPVAAWQVFTTPPGDRLAGPAGQPSALAAIASARTVAVVVDEVGRVGSLFGERFQRRVLPVHAKDLAVSTSTLVGADVLVTCRESTIGLWAATDPAHFHLLSDPESDLAVWRVVGRPSPPAEGPKRRQVDDLYCT
jgi:hypothetical protein